MCVPCILYSLLSKPTNAQKHVALFWCVYRASCTVYYPNQLMHKKCSLILVCVPCILYSLLSKPTNPQKNVALFWSVYRASCTVYYPNQLMHKKVALFWCVYRASCTVYYPNQLMHKKSSLILVCVPCILYSLLSKPTNPQKK